MTGSQDMWSSAFADAYSAMERLTVVKSNVSFCMLDPFVFEVFSVLGIFVGLLSDARTGYGFWARKQPPLQSCSEHVINVMLIINKHVFMWSDPRLAKQMENWKYADFENTR